MNPFTIEELRAAREKALRKKRRIVFHSDGMSMEPENRFLEPNPCVFPYIPGSQTDACTYSLIHQFPVVRLYRSKVAYEWPPGIIQKLYGSGPDGLNTYIDFCRKNNYEAFWAMRMNDTHDASDSEHGRRRWNSNKWKQAHPEYLVGKRGSKMPYGQWSSFDYACPEVREKVFRVLEEVCQNYEIDGLLLDFFRHLPTFKTTVMGSDATREEVEMMNGLLLRIREMINKTGAERRHPILLAVRTPDSTGYCRALGLDVEHWMEESLIDIWIATGYFRLQEWSETVAIGHSHNVQVWASVDESRVRDRENRNSLEIYRARIMNAWNAGVDAIWLFNFFYLPDTPQFQLLMEAGDQETLAYKDKIYVADARGQDNARKYLKEAERFFTRSKTLSPDDLLTLRPDNPETIQLLVGDDIASASTNGYNVEATLRIQVSSRGMEEDFSIHFNGLLLTDRICIDDWVEHKLNPRVVQEGTNLIIIACGSEVTQSFVLHDLQLRIQYH